MNKVKPVLVLTFLLLLTQSAFAVQELGQFGSGAGTPAKTASGAISNMDLIYYALAATVIIELIAIIILAFSIMRIIKVYFGIELKTLITGKKVAALASGPKKKWYSFERINQTVPIEKEGELLMEHDYDGIHELDNKMPPWFIWLFNVTITFSVIYLIVFHVIKAAPLQIGEYKHELAVADKQLEEYRKKSANSVDENNVVLLTDAAQISKGADVFKTNCVACHGGKGEGGVGPNLTDDYWLHGGSVKNIFKTIKYGVVEKGMRSWKDDLSPTQIQEVVSFIKTLHGTNPPNAKEKQGELYKEGGEAGAKPSDTIKMEAAKDSVSTAKL
ncbi:c-type cytochrome [Solitalea sp. MAHUQ-68]|uniref:C-type cytochrome n=1 Tax=Solitalea agri TaxID=2953739 RepID=A0A9X2F021_9SPHI|nr:cbb3-type cytochrome c oxidase N-terminal domain-containing protein [Solitalea agri]MCO4291620.1 c-type cytochrome [Solitalea agri]